MPHQPSPFSLLHLVRPACSFTGVSPSLSAHSPLHRTHMPVGALAKVPEHLHPFTPFGALWSKEECVGCLSHLGYALQACAQAILSNCSHFDCMCMCVVFAHQLKVWALSVSPSPLSAPVHHAVNGNAHQRIFSSPSSLSTAHGFLCCSHSSLF